MEIKTFNTKISDVREATAWICKYDTLPCILLDVAIAHIGAAKYELSIKYME